jgi:murein DD-endopeptidase MepM/ murein hydrolase activator NlpD
MTSKMRRRVAVVPALVVCFGIGVATGWVLREKGPPLPATSIVAGVQVDAEAPADTPAAIAATGGARVRPVSTAGEPTISAAPPPAAAAALESLRQRDLRVPIDGVNVESLKGSFDEHRSGAGGHVHDAADILAPRNTPIHAVENGTIAKLFVSKAGGNTIYEFDPSGEFSYYYAHLERYAAGLHDGQTVARGDVIGYVGTSGNAPPTVPHLHFAVYELGPEHHWWQGRAIDPYLVFHH